MRVKSEHISAYGRGEISLKKLIFYNLIFFIPILFLMYLSSFISRFVADGLQASSGVVSNLVMFALTFIFFLFIIPFIRKRENIKGVRYSLIGFLIVAVGVTIPAMIIKNFNPFLLELPHIATYMLLTFIYAPDVIGINIDISRWFKKSKQLIIILVYSAIVLGYIFGFGFQFFLIANDNPSAFAYRSAESLSYGTFAYYSTITFTTIGYGDITPTSSAARLLAGMEAIIGSIVNVIFIAILFVYISNFQAFLKGMKKEEKEIEILEKRLSPKKRKRR